MTLACLLRYATVRGAFVFAALAPIAGAQPQAWIRQFGSSGADHARAAAPDGSGGVYVGGDTWGSLSGQNAGLTDAWLARHDAAGDQLWIRQFGSSAEDSINAAAADGSGGVFVSGHTSGLALVARYDGGGNLIWLRQFNASGIHDFAYAAATDGSGGVYLTGRTGGDPGGPASGEYNAWLAHYDGAGNQTWIREFGTNAYESANGAAPDGFGGVYLSGDTQGSLGGPNAGGSGDAWLARYDGAGNQIWIRQLGTSGSDYAWAAATDGSSGVYLSGSTSGALGGPIPGFYSDAWVALYDGAGNQTWLRQFGVVSEDDFAHAAAPDGSGGVYVGGTTWGSLGGPISGTTAAWIARYDNVGSQTWLRQYSSPGWDSARAIASDGSGLAYVVGHTSGNLGGPAAGHEDVWLAHYDGSVSAIRYCNPAVQNSTGQSGTLTALGSLAVQANNVTLVASQLPQNSFGFFLTSRDQGNAFPVNNSQGRLCVGGFIGRYVGPGQIKNSGLTGTFSLVLDLTNMAHPFSPVVAQAGQTWYFTAWHRDANPSTTSNFTDAVGVTFM